MVSISEASRMIGFSRHVVRAAIRSGQLRSMMVGGRAYLYRGEVEDLSKELGEPPTDS